jgi:hypothetical protein
MKSHILARQYVSKVEYLAILSLMTHVQLYACACVNLSFSSCVFSSVFSHVSNMCLTLTLTRTSAEKMSAQPTMCQEELVLLRWHFPLDFE